jgi:hypothetical protein
VPIDDEQPEGIPEQIIIAIWLCYLMALRAAPVFVVVAGVTAYLALVYYGINGTWP